MFWNKKIKPEEMDVIKPPKPKDFTSFELRYSCKNRHVTDRDYEVCRTCGENLKICVAAVYYTYYFTEPEYYYAGHSAAGWSKVSISSTFHRWYKKSAQKMDKEK